ncbi:MAG: clostripain-related cysteine peptidase [Cyanobacteriota bacterium]
MKNIKITTIFALLSFFYACSTTNLGNTSLENTQINSSKEKTIFSIYMVGGNLEDDVKPRNNIPDEQELGKISTAGAGSNDLRELIEGYQNLSNEQKANLDIMVAFGGSRKDGWKGIKYADINCLIKDSDDRYFGNDTCYKYKDENSNMASSETLETFFKYVKNNYGNNKRKVVDLWDHGFAYLGMGQDSRNGNQLISLQKIKEAFTNSNLKVDLIGFDACLMGSIEVAKTVKDFSSYMVASEELEPAHGWNYTDTVNILAKNNSSFESIGKSIVDSFIDNPDHKEEFSKYKTLSLIDLKKVDNVIQKLDIFSSTLNMDNFSNLLNAVQESQKFGDANKNNLSYTIDLINWINNIKKSNSGSSGDSVLKALSEMVIYSRHDDSKPNSNGISIYSLSKNMENKYGENEAVSKNWLDFSRSFVRFGINDFVNPVIKEENFGTKSNKISLCNNKDQLGHCLDISDNVGLKSVEQIFSIKADERYYFNIGSKRLKEIDEKNKYFTPVWNGEWFLLCNGNCETGLSIFPTAYYNSYTESGNSIYSSDAVINSEDVIFYMEVDKNNNVVSEWAVPYTISEKGEVLLNRNQLKLNIGDTIQFYYQVYDNINKKNIWKKGESITFSAIPKWSFAKIDAKKLYYIQAEDYKGNISNSNVYEIN